MSDTFSSALVEAFAASMPESYRQKYSAQHIQQHAKLVFARGSDAFSLGFFEVAAKGVRGLCVVGMDRPGFLSAISAAIVMAGLDIVNAEAYTRNAQPREAVDLFWLRWADPQLREHSAPDEVLDAIREALTDLLSPTPTRHVSAGGGARPAAASESDKQDTVVRFIEDKDGTLTTLEVETADRSGLLFSLSQALFHQGVEIVQSEVKTVADRVFDRFQLTEPDGSAISEARRLEIQVAVLSAIEPIVTAETRQTSTGSDAVL